MATDDKVVIGQTHALDDPEAVLIGYLMGVEALRKDKQVVMWLTKDGVQLATPDFAAKVEIPGAPAVLDLHKEYVDRGGEHEAWRATRVVAARRVRQECRPRDCGPGTDARKTRWDRDAICMRVC